MGLSKRQAGQLTAVHRKRRNGVQAKVVVGADGKRQKCYAPEGVDALLEQLADELLAKHGDCRSSAGVLNRRQLERIKARECLKPYLRSNARNRVG